MLRDLEELTELWDFQLRTQKPKIKEEPKRKLQVAGMSPVTSGDTDKPDLLAGPACLQPCPGYYILLWTEVLR